MHKQRRQGVKFLPLFFFRGVLIKRVYNSDYKREYLLSRELKVRTVDVEL